MVRLVILIRYRAHYDVIVMWQLHFGPMFSCIWDSRQIVHTLRNHVLHEPIMTDTVAGSSRDNPHWSLQARRPKYQEQGADSI